jgi:hypothetical protein
VAGAEHILVLVRPVIPKSLEDDWRGVWRGAQRHGPGEAELDAVLIDFKGTNPPQILPLRFHTLAAEFE